jgi:hypothetical protein
LASAFARKPDRSRLTIVPDLLRSIFDATRTYWPLRDPSELRTAMKTFKQIPSLIDHRPLPSANYCAWIANTASNAEFKGCR